MSSELALIIFITNVSMFLLVHYLQEKKMKYKIIIELDSIDSFICDSNTMNDLEKVLTRYSLNRWGTNRGFIIHNYGDKYVYKMATKQIEKAKNV